MADWKINPNEVLSLINKYKQFKCLWNYRSPDYKRTHLKRHAWLCLSKEFQKDIEEVKKKVKYLRSAYVNEKKKVDDSIAVGGVKYQPRLFYYNQFNYLDSVIILRKAPSNSTACNQMEETRDDTSEEDTTENFNSEVIMPVRSPSPSPYASTSSERKPMKRKAYSPLRFDLSGNNTFQHGTIYSAFGTTIALQLGQLTPLEATSTMDEIHRLLSRNVMKSISRRQRRLSSENTGLSRSTESSRTNRLEAELNEMGIHFDDNIRIKNHY